MDYLKIDGMKIKMSSIRKTIGLDEGTKISINDVYKVSKYFKCSYMLFNEK